MVVNEEDVVNIMAGMEHAGGIKLNDHKRKLKNRLNLNFFVKQTFDEFLYKSFGKVGQNYI